MLLQTNSYIVPKDRRSEHARLMNRFRQVLGRIGCDHFEVYEQVGANWTGTDTSGRFVQIMRFRDNKHRQTVHIAERQSPDAQALVREFCELINMPYQEQQGLFATGYYQAVTTAIRPREANRDVNVGPADAPASAAVDGPPVTFHDEPTSAAPSPASGDAHEHVAVDLDDLSDDDSEIEPLNDEEIETEILEVDDAEPRR